MYHKCRFPTRKDRGEYLLHLFFKSCVAPVQSFYGEIPDEFIERFFCHCNICLDPLQRRILDLRLLDLDLPFIGGFFCGQFYLYHA